MGWTHTHSIPVAHPALAGPAQRSGEPGPSSLSVVITFQVPPEMMTRPSPQAFSQIFKNPSWAHRQKYKQKSPLAVHRSATTESSICAPGAGEGHGRGVRTQSCSRWLPKRVRIKPVVPAAGHSWLCRCSWWIWPFLLSRGVLSHPEDPGVPISCPCRVAQL